MVVLKKISDALANFCIMHYEIYYREGIVSIELHNLHELGR